MTLHHLNIGIHVLAGTTALIVGSIALIANKGKKTHRLMGRIFLYLIALVILTALIGVFVFARNTFLLVITVLVAYEAFSGYRILKTKSNKVKLTDVMVALIALISVTYFLYYFKSIGMIWSPVIIYSTVGYLVLLIVYDFGRYMIPARLYTNMWLYEHILKMVSALTGLLSAFSGTVFPQYQPYSQFIPSILGTLIAIVLMLTVRPKKFQPIAK